MDPASSAADQLAADSTAAAPDTVPTAAQLESRIDRETAAVIQQYFETFNRGDFAATAALFAVEGALLPPFESAVVGPEAIAAYLNQEAKGMQIELRQCVQAASESGITEVKAAGKVQTPLFGVNVNWMFGFNEALEILCVRIKLLAALEDLLKLKS